MQNIKLIRESQNLKQDEFATGLGITQSYLSALETGRKNVTNKLARKLFDIFKVSPEWFYNNNGNMYNISIGNESGVNDGVNAGDNLTNQQSTTRYETFLKGINQNYQSPENKDVIYKGFFEENKIDYYYRHPDFMVNRLLSVAIGDYKSAYTSYQTLCELSMKFGAPDFINEKFPPHISFELYIKQVDKEGGELHGHITDKKLLKCIRLVNYESEVEHWNNAIYRLVTYMNQYSDLYSTIDNEAAK